MFVHSILSGLAASAIYATATPVKRAVPYFNPTDQPGGSMLDWLVNGFGEPLNVIVSGLSSPEVLTVDGIVNFARAIGLCAISFSLDIFMLNPISQARQNVLASTRAIRRLRP